MKSPGHSLIATVDPGPAPVNAQTAAVPPAPEAPFRRRLDQDPKSMLQSITTGSGVKQTAKTARPAPASQ